MREISTAEKAVCIRLQRLLSSLPTGSSIGGSEEFRETLAVLERFVPEVLAEVDDTWKGESLDGIYPACAKKTAEREMEVIGLCCLLSDQALTPLHLQLQLDPAGDCIAWLDCRLGENTGHGMRREPFRSAIVHGNMLHVMKRLDSMEWCYQVGYGERVGE